MADQHQTPIYATVHYEVRKKLKISFLEYIYLDMVYKLSYEKWCYKSLENSAVDMGLSKRGLIKLRDRMIERGFLKKNIRGHLKVTSKYTGVAVNKVQRLEDKAMNLVPKSVNKVHSSGEQSATKNNNRITKTRELKDFRGEKSPTLDRIREHVKKREWGKLKA